MGLPAHDRWQIENRGLPRERAAVRCFMLTFLVLRQKLAALGQPRLADKQLVSVQ